MSVGDALGSNVSENKLVKAHMAWRLTEKKGTGRQETGKKQSFFLESQHGPCTCDRTVNVVLLSLF